MKLRYILRSHYLLRGRSEPPTFTPVLDCPLSAFVSNRSGYIAFSTLSLSWQSKYLHNVLKNTVSTHDCTTHKWHSESPATQYRHSIPSHSPEKCARDFFFRTTPQLVCKSDVVRRTVVARARDMRAVNVIHRIIRDVGMFLTPHKWPNVLRERT